MKKIALLLVVLLNVFNANSQNKDLDSLYHLLNIHPEEDTIRAKLLSQICYYESTSDIEKSKVHANEMLAISEKLHFTKGIGSGQRFLANYYMRTGDFRQATQHGLEMLKAYEGTTNYSGIGKAYATLASIHQDNGDFEDSKSYYLKALEVHKKAGLKMDMGYDYNGLATLFHINKKNEESLAYNLKALEIRGEINDKNGLSQTYGNIALAYKAKKEYRKAIEYIERALPITLKLNNKYRLYASYANLGTIYTEMGDYAKAELFLLKGLSLAKSMKDKLNLVEICDNLATLQKKKGNYTAAFSYIDSKEKYRDSLYSEEKIRGVAEVKAQYETEKKDQIIKSLEQQKQLMDLKQSFLFIVLSLVIISFTLIFVLQRVYNNRVNSLLATEKTLTQQLQESDQLKSSFFANISHEFRTPLSLILAPIEEKLDSAALNSADKASFQMIRRNANRLLSLVNQLLDLSKLEAKKMELQVIKGNVREFLAVLTASFDSLAQSKNIQFKKDIAATLSEGWYDADKVEKIVNNLLFNAFKFTSDGGTVTFLAVQATPADFKMTISDTGIGIAPEEQQLVFSPFYQSKSIADDGQPGTGLGLSMVKELVKLYGGKIELTSTVGQGTTISVLLPMTKMSFNSAVIIENEEPALATKPVDQFEELNSLVTEVETTEQEDSGKSIYTNTVLVVEDNDDLRNFISASLRDQFLVLTARDGNEGFAMAIEDVPDLIVSDVMMPGLDGISLAAKIKEDERTSHIPLVLLTAKADLESRMAGLKTGADDYLSKPFSTQELHVRIANLIEQRKKLAAKYRATISDPLPPKEPSIDEKFLMKAKQIVEAHMDDASFGVETMAEEICLSRTQLFRKLKAISGISPNEFINDIRLHKAAELIRARADTLTQISYSVGYSEQSYFAKKFRKKFGVSPGEYQAKEAVK